MTYDDIIRIARKAGWSGIYTKPLFSITMQEDDFLRFAALVAAAEREACAEIAESYEPTCETCPSGVANAIRARGET